MSNPSIVSALLLLFPAFNTFDLNGPIEIFNYAGFSLTIAAQDELTSAREGVTIKRDVSLAEAKANLHDYDILLVPGSRPDKIAPHLVPGDSTFSELLDLIAAFAQLGPSPKPGLRPGAGAVQRVLISVCTGSYFLGHIGALDGMEATTHHLGLTGLRQICADYAARTPDAKGTTVVPISSAEVVRYVDAGLNESNVKVITAGGISSSLDAALYLVSQQLGRASAEEVAAMLEYSWREM